MSMNHAFTIHDARAPTGQQRRKCFTPGNYITRCWILSVLHSVYN